MTLLKYRTPAEEYLRPNVIQVSWSYLAECRVS